jgi:hypothetical protein
MNSLSTGSVNIVGIAQQVTSSMVSGRTMFTAYDVTTKVRQIVGRAVSVPHPTVRDAVHQMFMHGAMGADYSRQSLRVGSSGDAAFVYHHAADDPNDYLNIINAHGVATAAPSAPATVIQPAPLPAAAQQVTDGSLATAAAAPATTTPQAQATNGVKRQTTLTGRGLDQFGRLRVPAKSLADAGFRPGDVAYVTVAQNGGLEFHRSRPSGVDMKSYLVDCYTNIRMKLPKGAASKFSFSASQGKVTASPAP